MTASIKTTGDLLLSGDRRTLARLISHAESTRSAHRYFVENVIEYARTLSQTSAFRIGFAGAAGAGKSTLINSLGVKIIEDDLKLAVLTIDPTSAINGGSLLGDAVRMGTLSSHSQVFVRSTPSGLQTGGISRATPVAVQLCELAGFEVILIESLGSGQIEYQLAQSVDLFFWLTTPGAGDDMQAMKQGVLEWVDGIIITQADRGRENIALESKSAYEQGVSLLQGAPYVTTLSAFDEPQLEAFWNKLKSDFQELTGFGLKPGCHSSLLTHLQQHRLQRHKLMKLVHQNVNYEDVESSYREFNDFCLWIKHSLFQDDVPASELLSRFAKVFAVDLVQLNWNGERHCLGAELTTAELSRLSLVLPVDIFCESIGSNSWPDLQLPLQRIIYIPLSLLASEIQGGEYASIFNSDFQYIMGVEYRSPDPRASSLGHDPKSLALSQQWSRALQSFFFEKQWLQLHHNIKRKLSGATDPLTGLASRESFKSALEALFFQSAEQNMAPDTDAFVFALDLHDFRSVNDALGLAAGDAILKMVADVLRQSIGEQDFIARFGGDEFFICAYLPSSTEAVEFFSEQLQLQIQDVVASKIDELKHFRCHIGCVALHLSCGLYDKDRRLHNVNEVLRAAGAALFAAKQLDQKQVFMYEMILKHKARSALFNKNELYKALTHEQFIYQAQPLFDYANQKCIGAELLLRWNHPTRGILPAGEFIASASDLGIIQQNDLRLIFKHLPQIMAIGKKYSVVFHLNLSAQLFVDQDIIHFALALEEKGALPYLHFEITEHDFIDRMMLLHQFIARVRAGGSEVWVDDFGIGYSGLRYLDLLSVDGVKIDQSFVRRLGQHRTQTLFKGVMAMLDSLQLNVLSEGVETQEEARQLHELGCDLHQGLLYGDALLLDDFVTLLERDS